jgi:holliday junction DNA helicase RuvA
MIGHIEGKVKYIREKYAIVSAGGIGYKVFMITDTISSLNENQTISLFTYLSVREDALDLYGFSTEEEHDFFLMLVSVSGIGPRSALGILGIAHIENLKKAIATGDTSYLTKVSGIGRKIAEKIVLELRDKMKAVQSDSKEGSLQSESDIVEALKSLGYSTNQARDALRAVGDEGNTNEKIKEALKFLAKN